MLNPNRSDCIELTLEIPAFAGQNTVPVMFPTAQEVENFALEMSLGSISSVHDIFIYVYKCSPQITLHVK